jgi:hypothetical protein
MAIVTDIAPSLEDFDEMAAKAFAGMPEIFRAAATYSSGLPISPRTTSSTSWESKTPSS